MNKAKNTPQVGTILVSGHFVCNHAHTSWERWSLAISAIFSELTIISHPEAELKNGLQKNYLVMTKMVEVGESQLSEITFYNSRLYVVQNTAFS